MRRRIEHEQPPRDFKPGQPGHLHVEEHDIRLELAGQPQRLHAVFGLAGDLDAARLAEQKAQFLAGQPLIVDNQHAQVGHGDQADARSGATISGISMRAVVPWPGRLWSFS